MASSENDRRIDYVEFVVADIGKARAFYENAFGWKMTDYGATYCAFADGRLEGGFTTQGTPKTGGPLIVLYADDLAAMQKTIEATGGKILQPAFDFPGGRRFHFSDPDGYELAVWTKG